MTTAALPRHRIDVGHADSKVRWSGRLLTDPGELHRAIEDGWLRDGVDGWRVLANDTARPITARPLAFGVLGRFKLPREARALLRSRPVLAPGEVLFLPEPNLVTISGIDRREQRLFGIGGPPAAVDTMLVDNGTVNPSAGTNRSADGNSTSRTLLAFDSVATYASPVTSATRTYTQATVAFIMKRLGMSAGTGDAAGTLHSMTNVFTMDMSAFSAWSQAFTAQATGTGS